MPVSRPATDEQNKISSFLELISRRIEKQQNLVNALKKYKRGVITKLLNGDLDFSDSGVKFEKKRIGDFCTVQMCKRVFKEQTSPTGDIPFYKIGTIGGAPDAYISRELFEEYKEKYNYPQKGEFLISCAGTVGKCVLFNGEDSYYQDSNIVWLRNNDSTILNRYLYLLVSNKDWSTLNSTTITRIYNDNLRDLVFDFPSIEIQIKTSSFVDALDCRISKEEKHLDFLTKQKSALLQQLFI